jgi:hypothetical protein
MVNNIKIRYPHPPMNPPPSIRKINKRIVNYIHHKYSYPHERNLILETGKVGEFVEYYPINQIGRLLEIIAYNDDGNKHLQILLEYDKILFDC